MQRLNKAGTFEGGQLLTELMAAIPDFQRLIGNRTAPDSGKIMASDVDVTIYFADDIDPRAIQTVIDAHVPVIRTPRDIKSEIRAVTSLDALKQLLEEILL